MTNPTPVVPTLSADSYLRDPVRIIAYTLTHYFAAPKSAMITWQNEAVSFKHTLADRRNGQEELLPEAISVELTALFSRIFGEPAQVDVSLHPGENEVTKTIRINVSVMMGGRLYSLDRNVTLSEDGRVSYAISNGDIEGVLTP